MTQETFEKKVVHKFLEIPKEPFLSLSKQIAEISVSHRAFTQWGFFTYFSIPDEEAIGDATGDMYDVVAMDEKSNTQYGFRLTVLHGKIDVLEGFAIMNGWHIDLDTAVLAYAFEERQYSVKMGGERM